MNTANVQRFVSLLLSGHSDDDALLRFADELANDGCTSKMVREHWPGGEFPVVAEYLCCGRLGHGSSGVVYQAMRFGKSPQWVALKVLRHAADQETLRFVEREIAILKALDCPNVARYLDSGHSGGSHYLAMEMLGGIPLDEYLDKNTTSLESKLCVFERACKVVAAVHEQGVVHRDLTPRHLLVDDRGQPHLVDFGLSAVQSDDWATRIRRTQTQLGRIMGTVKYMSPEQSWGGMMRIDHTSDIWALGVMLFEIATDGDYPYNLEPIEGKNAGDSLLHRIQHEVPKKPPVSDARGLTTLISRCLAPESHRRISSARQLGDDIANLCNESAIKTKPLPLFYRLQRIAIGIMLRSRTAVWMLIVAGVLFAISSGTFLLGIDFGILSDDHSTDARTTLLKSSATQGPTDFVFVGVGDDTAKNVIEFARTNGIPDVTGSIRTWRAVHGRLMRRLAKAKPKAVVWDYYFRSRQRGDPELVEGILALDRAGVPVALAAIDYSAAGIPKISPDIYDPLSEIVHHGLIMARDMVERPGEFVIVTRRGEQSLPSLALAMLGAVCYPRLRNEVTWNPGDDALTVQHRERGTKAYIKGIDRIQVKTLPAMRDGRASSRPGDIPATKTFDLTPLQTQESRTIAYEAVLRRSETELWDLVAGKIVLCIDLRPPSPFPGVKRDLHTVKYDEGIIRNVPGGYLLGDAIRGLISSRSVNRRHWLPIGAYSIIVGMAIVGCLTARLIAGRGGCRTRRAYLTTVGIMTAITLGCAITMFIPSARHFANWTIAGASTGAAAILALSVEYLRNLHRFPKDSAGQTRLP
ncbi:MAG: protein kinase [Planctomycetes bacterium]|nr:protein kinase [Planctomycetota bacterium]